MCGQVIRQHAAYQYLCWNHDPNLLQSLSMGMGANTFKALRVQPETLSGVLSSRITIDNNPWEQLVMLVCRNKRFHNIMGPSYKEYDDVHMQNLNVHEFTCEQGSLSAAAIIDKLSLLLSIMCNSCDSLEREPCLEVDGTTRKPNPIEWITMKSAW